MLFYSEKGLDRTAGE